MLDISKRFTEDKDLAHDVILKLYNTPTIKDRPLSEQKAWIYIITKNHFLNLQSRERYVELLGEPKAKESQRNLCIETDVLSKVNLTELEEKWLLAYIYEGANYSQLAKAIDIECRQTVSTTIREIIEKCKKQL